MSNINVSIILPTYNSMNEIGSAIDSILSQDYDKIELIIIDDGSTDQTEQICKEICEKDKRVKYIKKKNGGASSARNLGLEVAIGDYVLFVDADDTLEKQAIFYLVRCIEKNKSDIVVGLYNCGQTKDKIIEVNKEEALEFAMNGTYKNIAFQHANFGSPWAKIFRKQFLKKNNIVFPANISHREDLIFCIQGYLNAENIILLQNNVYHYNVGNVNSLVNRFNSNGLWECDRIVKYFLNIKWQSNEQMISRDSYFAKLIYDLYSENIFHYQNPHGFYETAYDIRFIYENIIKNNGIKECVFNHYKELSFHKRVILWLTLKRQYYVLTIIALIWRKRRVNCL